MALKDRHGDLIWKVQCQGRPLCIYLLLEFQSSVDRLMSWRLFIYVALLCDHLLQTKVVSPTGRVLYNGDRSQQAAKMALRRLRRGP